MINLSIGNTIDQCAGLISWETCKEECIKQVTASNYEFVWLFVIGFMFTQFAGLIFNWKIFKVEHRLILIKGLQISGYVLNIAGILYFLLIAI